VNVASLGNTIYASLANSPTAEVALRAEMEALALAIATDPGASSVVTSATVNGQTFSARSTMTQHQRLQLLRWVIRCFDHGGTISPTQLTTFSPYGHP
jgi:hypothetical protein